MAALPSPTQVAGTHSGIYEAYYHQVDPNATGAIQALDAARFLKKSRLSDVVLSKIWDLSDPNGRGYLDKAGLFVALKLVALAQAGKDINMSNIHSEAPPPKVGELPKVAPPARPAAPVVTAASDWLMKPAEREKYSQLFDSLQPNNGLIAGNKVRGVLMESKLPLETLGKIWDLADQDKDGMLDRHEFMVAMHLVYKALERHAIPVQLPAELCRPASPRPPRPAPPPAHPPPPAHQTNAELLEGLLDLSSPPSPHPPQWVVPPSELSRYASMFTAADADRDGLVSGLEIKSTLLESGLPQHTLAHIWALCDTASVGKLSSEQFALAMWLVERARRGLGPPAALSDDMVPPSCRTAAPPRDKTPLPHPQIPEPVSLGPQPTPELEAIAREVDALARERLALEADLAAKERDQASRQLEADSLQSELDTLTATLKQLENQKGEAQKRLNDLKSQVEKLRCQVSAQEAAAAETEAEVAARRAAHMSLREREAAAREDLALHQRAADDITAQLSRTVLAVSQARIKLDHLESHLEALESATAALSSGAPSAEQLALAPAHSPKHLHTLLRGTTPNDALEDESFSQSATMNGSGFESDPFKDSAFPPAFPSNDPFAPSGQTQGDFGFSQSFASPDPFAGDAFAPTNNNNTNAVDDSDPFAVLHAPLRSSPTPALPPKKSKVPPPRPAPPRAKDQPPRPLDFTEDPFKDYRYEDPFNIQDPFADVTDAKRPTSVAGFETDDFFGLGHTVNGGGRSGRVSAPPAHYDPFAQPDRKPMPTISNDNESWAAWPNDNWAADDAWAKPPATAKPAKPDAWADNNDSKPDAWPDKSDNWATDWGSTDQNKNLNETWPSSTLPAKKEKSPKPVKYAKSIVHTIGGIGRSKHYKEKKEKAKNVNAERAAEPLPSEEQQWAWAAQESKRLEKEAEERRRREDAELQLALAISRQEK